jgi:uncharacterized protein (DUF58 family)
MLSISRHSESRSIIDPQALHALGVLVPIRFQPVKVLPGRHPLGRAGDGMRLLRTRPYIAGEDNPRDIDKFSPPGERRVVEWEDEAQASIMLLADISASMVPALKSALRNACLLQLTYSFWRAGDRVGVTFFDDKIYDPIRATNLRMQMQRVASALKVTRGTADTDLSSVLGEYLQQGRQRFSDLLFVVSDFLTSGEHEPEPESEWRPVLNEMHRNIVPVVISFEIPADMTGVMKFWDPERRSRRLVRLSARRVRSINQQEADRVAALVRKFQSAGLDYMILSKQRQIYPQLARLARTRRLRKH